MTTPRPKQSIAAFRRQTTCPASCQSESPGFEQASGRLEIVNRIKLWRFLTGDETFDVNYWLGRLENQPA